MRPCAKTPALGRALRPWLALGLVLGLACSAEPRSPTAPGRVRIVFAHQPLWGDPARFEALLDGFRRARPEIEVVTELLPGASGVLHQHLLTTLAGGQAHFDLFVGDVVWVAELARAGWVAELSAAFPPDRLRQELVSAAAEAAIVDGRSFAVPWWVDVGLLLYRKDLVPAAPRSYQELEGMVAEARRRRPELQGFLWQGRQYEGLVCNGLEAGWGQLASVSDMEPSPPADREALRVDTPALRAGLAWLRHTITSGVSPRSVLSAGEEETRRSFQDGRAVFLRNWPYAFLESQREGSPIRGKVGWAPLPSRSGAPGPGTLGGWSLLINARSSPARRAAATQLIAHLSSLEASVELALAYGRSPARRAAYADPRLVAETPFLAGLAPIVARARPRPLSPYYVMMSDVLQGAFSSVVAGVATPAAALTEAQRRIDYLTRGGR